MKMFQFYLTMLDNIIITIWELITPIFFTWDVCNCNTSTNLIWKLLNVVILWPINEMLIDLFQSFLKTPREFNLLPQASRKSSTFDCLHVQIADTWNNFEINCWALAKTHKCNLLINNSYKLTHRSSVVYRSWDLGFQELCETSF